MDIRNKAEATPLHLAARHGHTEIARFLCLAGMNINIQDKVNKNFIFFFVKIKLYFQNRIIELLVN
jgi:ankyrin repeat protein